VAAPLETDGKVLEEQATDIPIGTVVQAKGKFVDSQNGEYYRENDEGDVCEIVGDTTKIKWRRTGLITGVNSKDNGFKNAYKILAEASPAERQASESQVDIHEEAVWSPPPVLETAPTPRTPAATVNEIGLAPVRGTAPTPRTPAAIGIDTPGSDAPTLPAVTPGRGDTPALSAGTPRPSSKPFVSMDSSTLADGVSAMHGDLAWMAVRAGAPGAP
jgi:hypothetical protein